MSTISGTGIQTFKVGSTVTVTVTSKDSSGNLIGVGGDIWLIKITNECTKANDYEWAIVSSAATTLSSSISGVMSDKGDGTYTYSYTVTNTGKISVHVYLKGGNGWYAEYHSGSDYSGEKLGSAIETNINRFYSGEEDIIYSGKIGWFQQYWNICSQYLYLNFIKLVVKSNDNFRNKSKIPPSFFLTF